MKKCLFTVLGIALVLTILNCSSDKPIQQHKMQSTNLTVSFLKSSLLQRINTVTLTAVASDQIVVQDTTELTDGAFVFPPVQVPAGQVTFTVRGLDSQSQLLYSGTSVVNILPDQNNNVALQLLPAVAMVKLTPYKAEAIAGSPVTCKLELYNVAKFNSGTFIVLYSPNLVRFDAVSASNQAWGELSIQSNLSEVGLIITVSRPQGLESIPPDVFSLLDLRFMPLSGGNAELGLSVDRMVDNQGTVQEITNGTLRTDSELLSITQTSQTGSITGTVTDAQSGLALDSVTVSLSGPVSREATGGADGLFSFQELPYGSYEMSISRNGYISTSRSVVLNQPTVAVTVVISKVISAGQYRAVLSWGETPRDLDAHLWTQGYEVYFSNQGAVDSLPYVYLDHDETGGFGPETITIFQLQDTCKYAVYNFSGTPNITVSQAHVELFKGSNLIQSFDIPVTGIGTWWYVFDLSPTGAINIRNTITDVDPGTGQQAPPQHKKRP